jgi:hypothetical protein
MTQPSPSVVPSSPLTIPNTVPPPVPGPTPPSRFVLFTNDWLQLQNYISQALTLPIDTGDWNDKYGSFADQGQVTTVLGAMTNVQGLCATFGDPETLRQEIAENPGYLLTPTAPPEIYGNIVWLASQIENAASTFTFTFQGLSEVLDPSAGTPAQRAANLTTILTGQGGLTSTAADMQTKTTALLGKLATFETSIGAANTQLVTYTSAESQIVADANQIVAQDKVDRDSFQSSADDALKKWRDYTIAAVATSVGIMIITGGALWPLAVGLGAGLGAAAAYERGQYNDFMAKVQGEDEDISKKNRLLVDLAGLNTAIAPVASSLQTFDTALQSVEGVWSDIQLNLNYIATNYGVDQLSDLSWVMQTMDILDAEKKWQAISDTAQQFTQNSLVSYDTSVTWPNPIPDGLAPAQATVGAAETA